MLPRRRHLLILAAVLLAAGDASAQRRTLSEKASITQTVAGTTITIEYSRPVARGRDPLFGGPVMWDTVWTPGANWATTFETSKDIEIEGEKLAKGRYSLWMVPREHEAWSLLVHEKERVFHTQRPRDGRGTVLEVRVQPDSAAHMETLTWHFPVIEEEGAELRMHWGTTSVPIRIRVFRED